VSVLFAAAALGMFFAALGLGRDLKTARTIVVNALVVLQVFYLFNVRYLHMTSLTLRGALGTPAVLWALAAIVAAQLLLTYTPLMQQWFATRPLGLLDGAVLIACGAAFMFLLEAEKVLLRRFGVLEKPPSGTPAPESSRAG
jgi:magnesium-transporting ATPase (P-type)